MNFSHLDDKLSDEISLVKVVYYLVWLYMVVRF